MERSVTKWLPYLLLLGVLGGCDNSPGTVPEVTTDLTARLRQSVVFDEAVSPGHIEDEGKRGSGWYSFERTRGGIPFAWTEGTRAELAIPLQTTAARLAVVHGYCLKSGQEPNHLQLTINGTALPAAEIPHKWGPIEIEVPTGVLRRGTNDILLDVDRAVVPAERGNSRDRRPLGIAVSAIHFLPLDAPRIRIEENPYAGESIALARGRRLSLQLANPAGSRLELEFSPPPAGASASGHLEVELAGGSGSVSPVRHEIPVRNGRADLAFPVDLPSPCRLDIQLGSDFPEEARLAVAKATLHTPALARNIVLIVIDTLRPDYLGCYAGQGHDTPAIDTLAADGILFETALCATPITGPSHASLLTSRVPSQIGILNNARGKIPLTMATLPEILQDASYTSGAAVSISPIAGGFGFARGFDRYEDDLGISWILNADVVLPRALDVLAGLAEPMFFWAHFSDPHEPYDAHGLAECEAEVLLDGKRLAMIPTSTYTPTGLELDLPDRREAELVIRSNDLFRARNVSLRTRNGSPPSLTVDPSGSGKKHYRAVIGREEPRNVTLLLHLADRTGGLEMNRKRYAREVSFVDRHVGLLLDELRRRGLYDESLIILTADHGEALGDNGYGAHVETVYDCMVRVPLIIKPPLSDGDFAGTRRGDQAALLDLLPTILGRISAHIPTCEGRDLLAPGADRQTVEVFLETHQPESSRTLFGLRGRGCKIIFEPETGTWEYYDLETDPGESNNIFDAENADMALWQDKLLTRLSESTSGDTAAPDAVDAKTREMLRSLGY